jgi:hypothetical protein
MEDPTEAEEEAWCLAQRACVLVYLREEGFLSPTVGEWPAWYVVPILSVWAVESVAHHGSVGWWAVSGDVPSDYTTCSGERHPRQALRDIGLRWRDAATRWARGEHADGWGLRKPEAERELAPLLASRAELLLSMAADNGTCEEWRNTDGDPPGNRN